MSDNIDFKGKPLWEDEQVITLADIQAIRNGYIYQYKKTKWWRVLKAYKFLVAVGTINAIVHWMMEGKPTDVLKEGM